MKIKKRLALLCTTALIGLGTLGGLSAAVAEETPLDLFEETYTINQTIAIPEYFFNGVKADVTVETPDGGAYRVNSVKLDSYGWYTVTYTAKVGGVLQTYTEKFFVNPPRYYVEGEKGGFSYEETIFSEGNKDLVVSLAEGEIFRYEKVIDLSDNTAKDDILSMYVVPGNVGAQDFNYLYFTFTDLYDESISFTVRVWQYNYQLTASYALVTFGDEPYIGTDWNRQIYTNAWGLFNTTDFCGLIDGTPMYEQLYKIRYDTASKQVSMPNYISDKTGENLYWNLVADLDDPIYYDKAFPGFTTGEVKLSVHCGDYVTSTARLAFVDIAGDDLSDPVLDENSKPEITLEESAATPPTAVVGAPYKLFGATAFDKEDGALQVTANVYYNYNSTAKTSVAVENGRFTPKATGTYTIEYVATDKLGEKSVELVEVDAVQNAETLSVSLTNKVTTGVAGYPVAVATWNVENGYDYGEPEAEITVTDPNGQKYEAEKGYFRAIAHGTYTVEYVVTMYNGVQATNSYTVEVEENTQPVFFDEADLPEFYLSGGVYTLPMLKAYDVSSGRAVEVPVSVYYKSADGVEKPATDNKIYPVGVYGDDESVTQIIYRATSNGETKDAVYSVPTINPKNGDFYDYSKFFRSEDATLTPSQNGVVINTVTDGASVSYIKEINREMLGWTLRVNPEKNAFKQIDVYLSDASDPSQSIKVSIFSGGQGVGNTYVTLNDGMKQYVSRGSFTIPEGHKDTMEISLQYNSLTKKITDLVNPAISVKKTLNGEPFKGFESGAVNIRLALSGVSGESEIYWVALGNHYFTKEEGTDNVSPTGILTKDCGGDYKYGQEFIIPAVKAYDFISANVAATVSVKTPEGKYAVSVDGVTLNNVDAGKDYYVKGNEYGKYVVSYALKDDNQNTNYSMSFLVNIVDATSPTLVLNAPAPTQGKVGEVIEIPTATYKDDITSEPTLFLLVAAPNGRRTVLKDYKFIATIAGKYTVYYMVVDEAGNSTLQSFVINVTE